MTHRTEADEWIERLGLTSHPEGGAYRELYRSPGMIPAAALPGAYGGARSYVTSIYFLLKSGECSHLHRLRSDELWYFHTGSPLVVSMIDPSGGLTEHRLGFDTNAGEVLQCTVPAGSWFGSRVTAPDSYALVSCVVAPGFDFADFELASRSELVQQFPEHARCIEALTSDLHT